MENDKEKQFHLNNSETHIDNPETFECPVCKTTYGIVGDGKIILRKITFLYINKKTKKKIAKCKKCRNTITLDF